MKKHVFEEWSVLSDTPHEFQKAINNAVTNREREFFEKIRHKFLHETAASNDVLMSEDNNTDGVYILRVGTDDILLGKNLSNANDEATPQEFAGLFMALEHDLFEYVHRHVTLLEWLRERDYEGIQYDANNDNN